MPAQRIVPEARRLLETTLPTRTEEGAARYLNKISIDAPPSQA